MRRFFGVALLALVVAMPAMAQESDRVARTFTEEYPRAGNDAIVFALNVGELEVVGGSGDTITAEVRVRCASGRNRERCRDRAEGIEISERERRGKLFLEIEGTGMWKSRDATVYVKLTVPHDLPLEVDFGTGELKVADFGGDVRVDMSIGEATLENVRGNVSIDMGIGEVSVSMPQDIVGEVTLDNGVGETELLHRDGRNAMEGILGGTDVHWDNGDGPRKVTVNLNVGEISVRLQ